MQRPESSPWREVPARTRTTNGWFVSPPEVREEAGAEVDVIDLRDFPLPLFDQDLEREEGTPEAATRLKGLMVEHDAFSDLIARVQQLNQRRPEERYRLGESPAAPVNRRWSPFEERRP